MDSSKSLWLKISYTIDEASRWAGALGGVAALLLALLIVYDASMRYIFHEGSIALQELEWHTFAVIMLYGTGYALRYNAHVRVDFLYDRLSPRKQAWINILGTILFLLPLALLVEPLDQFPIHLADLLQQLLPGRGVQAFQVVQQVLLTAALQTAAERFVGNEVHRHLLAKKRHRVPAGGAGPVRLLPCESGRQAAPRPPAVCAGPRANAPAKSLAAELEPMMAQLNGMHNPS